MKQTAELLRARLRGLFGGAEKEQQEAGHRSCPPGARAPGRVRGLALWLGSRALGWAGGGKRARGRALGWAAG